MKEIVVKTIARAALIAAAVIAVALVGGGSARAASPDTLGAAVQSRVYVNDSRTITVKNLSTVAATFAFEPAGGWTTDPATVDLAPGATGVVAVVGSGSDGASIGITVTSARPVPPGTSRTSLAFQAKIAHDAPFDVSPWIRGALGAVLVLFVVARLGVAATRLARRYSITRKGAA